MKCQTEKAHETLHCFCRIITIISTFDLWCRETEGRKKVLLILHASAIKPNANYSFCLGLSNDFGFIPVFVLEIRYSLCTEE